MSWRKLGLALTVVSVLGVAAKPAAAGPVGPQPPIATAGGQIFASFIGFSAALRSELWYFGNTPQGPSAPAPGTGRFLFANQGSNISAFDGSTALGSPTTDLSGLFGGPYAAGTPLYFGLFVQGLFPSAVGSAQNAWFFVGPATNNFDGNVHAVVTGGPYLYTVGFEDLCAQGDPGCNHPAYSVDWDYNDHMFNVSATPEPISMTLIGTGLVGLAGFARRRRKNVVA